MTITKENTYSNGQAYQEHSTDIHLEDPLNLNDPVSVEQTLTAISRKLLAEDTTAGQHSGLWLKNEIGGFSAAIADARRQELSVGDTIGAALNCYGTLIGLMIKCIGGEQDEKKELSTTAAHHISYIITQMVQQDAGVSDSNSSHEVVKA